MRRCPLPTAPKSGEKPDWLRALTCALCTRRRCVMVCKVKK